MSISNKIGFGAIIVPVLTIAIFVLSLDEQASKHIGAMVIPIVTTIIGIPSAIISGLFVVAPCAIKFKSSKFIFPILIFICSTCAFVCIGIYTSTVTNINLDIWWQMVSGQFKYAAMPIIFYALIVTAVVRRLC